MFIRDINDNAFPMEMNYDTYFMNGWFIVYYSKKIRDIKYHVLKEKIYINDENTNNILELISGKKMKEHLLYCFEKELIKDFGL